MKEVLDEILEGEPLYDISDGNGNLIQSGVKIEMTTPVRQMGTPLNKALFDSIETDLTSTYRNIPKGLICMWSGSEVPTGWLLCNGENNTPDLRDRFIVGSGTTYTIGDTGGSNTVQLTTNNLPSHKHNIKIGIHDLQDASGFGTNSRLSVSSTGDQLNGDDHRENWTLQTQETGETTAHENRPPYYALAFIMKA